MDGGRVTASFAGLTLDRPRVMAIVNVTPDSFSDGGERLEPARAVEDGLRFWSQGADIVDVGGESTRPGSHSTALEEELKRVVPVVSGLARRGVTVSIDTRRAAVARACLDAGARIVNDVSGLRDDAAMAQLVASRRADIILMHRRGGQTEAYEGPAYDDVVEDVRGFLLDRARAAEKAGIERRHIAIDPGIGFGKSVAENVSLIANVRRLVETEYPVLVGSSRKSFIGKLTGLEMPRDRDPASVWLAVEAFRRGAAIVRVHDVAGTRQALAVAAAMR
jgi:dihydropteroate synthase